MNEETQKLIMRVVLASEWDYDDCLALCKLAGLEDDWWCADGETFECVVWKAIDILTGKAGKYDTVYA